MKVLLIHTYYHIRGGEDQVFEQEFDLLSKRHEVMKLSFQNISGIRGLFQFFNMVNNLSSNTQVSDIIKSFDPDIVHIHNLHFAAGYGIINTIKKYNLPIVMTLHNYRFLCPSGTLFDGKTVFLDSLNSNFPWKAVFKKVYKNSFLLTFWLSLMNYHLNNCGSLNRIDKYIVLTNFAKDLFKSSKLKIDDNKFIVKPNSVKSIDDCLLQKNREDFLLFVGRFSEEKGIQILFNIIPKINFQVRFAGTGPLLGFLENLQKYKPNQVTYLGVLNRVDILNNMSTADILIFPSIWYEGMPMTIIEAFSVGLPVVASDLGAMSTMIKDGVNGFLYDGTEEGLLLKIKSWRNLNAAKKNEIRQNAYNSYLDNYTEEVNLVKLENIYFNTINVHEENNYFKS